MFNFSGSKVSWDCHKEMTEHRRMLLEDYRLSPEIVSHCSNDILEYCNGLEAGGRTIHCLMEHSRPKRRKDRVSPPCQRAVSIVSFDLNSIKFKKGKLEILLFYFNGISQNTNSSKHPPESYFPMIFC